MTKQQGAPEALAHELFTAAQLAPGEGISDAVTRIAALVEAQQPAHPEQQPFGWIKQSEIDSSKDFGGSINLWRRQYDCDVPVYLAQQPAPSAAAAPSVSDRERALHEIILNRLSHAELLEKAHYLMELNSNQARTIGELQDLVKAAPLPSPTPQADSAQDEPLQAFDSPRAKALMRAWEEGWAACRDAEYVGEEAQNDAFNSSHTLTLCIAEDQQLPAPQADSQPAPVRGYPQLPEPKYQMGGKGHSDAAMRAYVDADRAARAPSDSVPPMTAADAQRYAEIEADSGASDFAAGIPKAADSVTADSVLEDAARYRALRDEAYQLHEDDICVSDSAFTVYFGSDLDDAVDALIERAARKQGANQ